MIKWVVEFQHRNINKLFCAFRSFLKPECRYLICLQSTSRLWFAQAPRRLFYTLSNGLFALSESRREMLSCSIDVGGVEAENGEPRRDDYATFFYILFYFLHHLFLREKHKTWEYKLRKWRYQLTNSEWSVLDMKRSFLRFLHPLESRCCRDGCRRRDESTIGPKLEGN